MITTKRILAEVKGYPRFVKLLMVPVSAGAIAILLRFMFGLGAITNLNDLYPWGLWIGWDVVTSVPLAAGAFIIGAIVHCFRIKRLEALVRPSIVTGFLGYFLVCMGLLIDLGQPQRCWHVFVYPNLHSPMLEVALCVMTYTTVVLLEFLSPVCEKFGFRIPLRLLRHAEMPLVVLGAAIATLHQSSIGTFFLIAVDKLHNLWYNPILPLLFWISAIFTGLSMVMIEAIMVHRHLGQPDETDLLAVLTRIISWFLAIYLVLKVYALIFLSHRPLFDRPVLTALFLMEIGAGVVIPMLLFFWKRSRTNSRLQLWAASLVVLGLALNRFNVSMFGLIQRNQEIYYPSFLESVVTLGIISTEVLLFFVIARYFPIFEHHPEAVGHQPDGFRKTQNSPTPALVASQVKE